MQISNYCCAFESHSFERYIIHMEILVECGIQDLLTLYMSNMAGVFYEAGSAYPSRTPVFNSGFWWSSCCSFFLLNSLLCCSIMCRYVLSSCCDVRYDFRIKTMFGSSLPPVVCRRAHVLFTLFVFICVQRCPIHIVLWFCLFSSSVLCIICCQFLWNVPF